jgi:hypothetical protein
MGVKAGTAMNVGVVGFNVSDKIANHSEGFGAGSIIQEDLSNMATIQQRNKVVRT